MLISPELRYDVFLRGVEKDWSLMVVKLVCCFCVCVISLPVLKNAHVRSCLHYVIVFFQRFLFRNCAPSVVCYYPVIKQQGIVLYETGFLLVHHSKVGGTLCLKHDLFYSRGLVVF